MFLFFKIFVYCQIILISSKMQKNILLCFLILPVGILFTCFCVTTTKRTVKKCFPDDVAQQNLIVSNTEGPGEEVTVNQN
jgi:hypothetical protein